LPEGTKLRADVAALRNGKSLSAMIADVVVEAFAQPSPLDNVIASLAAREYDVDAPFLSRRHGLEAYRADAAALMAAIDQEISKAHADKQALQKGLKGTLKAMDARIANAPAVDPSEN